jgi:hypothetical protein
MRNLSMLLAATSLAAMPQAFANPKNAKTDDSASGATTETAATTSTQDRATPVIGEVAFLALPAKAPSRAGGKSSYDFDKLDAPRQDENGNTLYASFPVMNKTAKQLRSVVSAANKRQLRDASHADGSPKFKMKELTDANGAKVTVATSEREQEYAKYFRVFETDPTTDPAGAAARVFRTDNPKG